jgi:outer membrane protein assembly factor BamB
MSFLPPIENLTLRRLRARVGGSVVTAALLLAAGCSRPPEPVALSADSLAGSWTAEVTRNGQRDVFAIAFKRSDDGTIPVMVAMPAIEAWSVPVGTADLDIEAGTVTVGKWTLTWDPIGPALTAELPETLVPVHTIQARFTRSAPIEPVVPPPNGSPVAEPAWTYDAGAPIWGGVTYGDGTVYVGDDAGVLHAVDAATGRQRWRVATGGAIRARPTLEGQTLYVPSDDGLLYRVDAADGRVRWKIPVVEGEFKRGDRFDFYAGSAVIEGGTLYLGTGDGRVHALDPADGSTRWTFRAGDAVGSTPAVADGRVFVGSFDGNVYALDAASGEVLWQHDTGAPVSSSAAVAGNRVLIGSRSYDLFAFDAATGEIDWQYYYWFSWIDSDPTVVGDTAYIGSSDALKVLALDVESGRPRWTFRTGGWSWAKTAVADDVVYTGAVGVGQYIGERRGGFFAFSRRDGSPRWQYPVEKPEDGNVWGFASSPATGGDHVFVGGLDRTLYAFSRAPV